MRILVVAQRLPPDRDPEAICTAKLINALTDYGVEVFVVCSTQNPDVRAKKIFCVPFNENESLFEKGTRLLNRYPETGWHWAKRTGCLITRVAEEANIEAIYSRAMPFVSHLATLFARRPSNTAWIAHFSDPWPADDFWEDKTGRRLRWHRRVIEACDAVSFPCQRVADYTVTTQWGSARPRSESPIIVPHVSHFQKCQPTKHKLNAPVQFLHCGNFQGTRRPDTLLRGWAQWLEHSPNLRSSVKLVQVGTESAEFTELSRELEIEDTVNQIGSVSYLESLNQMAAADFLVLVENGNSSEGIYLPSKLIDYLTSSRPIIALSSSTGTVADILGAQYALRAAPASQDEVADVLCQLGSQQFQIDTSAQEDLQTAAKQFLPDQVAKNMVAELERSIDVARDRTTGDLG